MPVSKDNDAGMPPGGAAGWPARRPGGIPAGAPGICPALACACICINRARSGLWKNNDRLGLSHWDMKVLYHTMDKKTNTNSFCKV